LNKIFLTLILAGFAYYFLSTLLDTLITTTTTTDNLVITLFPLLVVLGAVWGVFASFGKKKGVGG